MNNSKHFVRGIRGRLVRTALCILVPAVSAPQTLNHAAPRSCGGTGLARLVC